ncbi:hypothetical protein INQ71_26225, partial [Escherichia coli]|uniref:hypothetical protein n=1 Tax=Escherichia coli TaxID=562 RepID=UPI001E558172
HGFGIRLIMLQPSAFNVFQPGLTFTPRLTAVIEFFQSVNRQWLTEEMQWSVPEGNFWDDEKLQRRLASRLDRWVSLMRMHG